MTFSLRTAVFYRMQLIDPELANVFAARCGDVYALPELNNFWHLMLSRLPCDTYQLRSNLDDHVDFETWWQFFAMQIMPLIQRHGFPPLTIKSSELDGYQTTPVSTASIPLPAVS